MKTIKLSALRKKEKIVNPRFKSNAKKNHLLKIAEHDKPEIMLQDATTFLQALQELRSELIHRDEAYLIAKKSGDKAHMNHYHEVANVMSKKCLDYSRNLCEQPIPHWVEGNLTKEQMGLAKHAYEVIRNKMCASLNVFDNDLLPNARALIMFAEGRLLSVNPSSF